MNSLEKQDPAYLVNEYNNQFLQPVFVTQMMDGMAVVKLDYLGTATPLKPTTTNCLLPYKRFFSNSPQQQSRNKCATYKLRNKTVLGLPPRTRYSRIRAL
jgi:hypothetical protein